MNQIIKFYEAKSFGKKGLLNFVKIIFEIMSLIEKKNNFLKGTI